MQGSANKLLSVLGGCLGNIHRKILLREVIAFID